MSPGNESHTPSSESPPWEPTACILCECNCGIQVQLGGDDGRQFARIRGDRANPVSKGYVCQKAGRLNHYQNSRDRLLAAMLGVLLEENLTDSRFIARHTDGFEQVRPHLEQIDIQAACSVCGVSEELVRTAVRRIAAASSVAVFEDLGVQMNRNSTLVSYLQRLVWMLTGNFGKHGAQNVPTSLVPITAARAAGPRRTPVTGAPVIAGLVPCNLIADEILSDHPNRYRAMLIESANPVHSLAESRKMREALKALECVVVIDIAMTETARLADYVLPATTQYEKADAVFFNFEFPENAFFLRQPLLSPPVTDKAGPLPEPEIHSRLTEALGGLPPEQVEKFRTILREGGRPRFASAFKAAIRDDPHLAGVAPALLYRTLGETLPTGAESAAALWSAAQICAARFADSIRRAGIEGEGSELGDALFDAIVGSPTGLVFSIDPPEVSWKRVQTATGRLQLAIPELFEAIEALGRSRGPAITSETFPLVLSAGERRSFTANTIYRDPKWRRKALEEALALSPNDAAALKIADGDPVRLVTAQGSAEVLTRISDRMQDGHISLPNGMGLDYPDELGERTLDGIAPNEPTAATDRDPIAGTPWHKSVPARLERLTDAAA